MVSRRRPKRARESVFAIPKRMPVNTQVLILGAGALLLALAQAVYWATVQPGDRFYFPGYRHYVHGNGSDAIIAGYVGSSVSAGLAVWITIETVRIVRGDAEAWARGAAAAALAGTAAACLIAGGVCFAFDLPEITARWVTGVSLFGGATIAGLCVFPTGRELREHRQGNGDQGG